MCFGRAAWACGVRWINEVRSAEYELKGRTGPDEQEFWWQGASLRARRTARPNQRRARSDAPCPSRRGGRRPPLNCRFSPINRRDGVNGVFLGVLGGFSVISSAESVALRMNNGAKYTNDEALRMNIEAWRTSIGTGFTNIGALRMSMGAQPSNIVALRVSRGTGFVSFGALFTNIGTKRTILAILVDTSGIGRILRASLDVGPATVWLRLECSGEVNLKE